MDLSRTQRAEELRRAETEEVRREAEQRAEELRRAEAERESGGGKQLQHEDREGPAAARTSTGRGASHGVSAAAMPSARGGRGARAARGSRGGRGGPSPKPYPDSSPHPTPQRGGRGGRGCSLAAPSDELVQPDAPPLLAESAPQLI